MLCEGNKKGQEHVENYQIFSKISFFKDVVSICQTFYFSKNVLEKNVRKPKILACFYVFCHRFEPKLVTTHVYLLFLEWCHQFVRVIADLRDLELDLVLFHEQAGFRLLQSSLKGSNFTGTVFRRAGTFSRSAA